MHTGMTIAISVGIFAVAVIGYTYYSDMKDKEEENQRIVNQQLASRENSQRNNDTTPNIGLGIIDLPAVTFRPAPVPQIYFNPASFLPNSQQINVGGTEYMIPRIQNFSW